MNDKPNRYRSVLVWALAAVVVGAVFWAASGGGTPAPYSPTSTQPSGAKALAIVLRRLGDNVSTAGVLPPLGRGVVLVMQYELDSATRSQVTAWVRAGGTLVVTDPTSPLADVAMTEGLPDQVATTTGLLSPRCGVSWASGVGRVDPGGAPLLQLPPGAVGCFPQDGNVFAVYRSEGRGRVVCLGGPELWSNQYLGRADNALLAADLLAPRHGTKLAWLLQPRVGGGNETLWGIVPLRAKAFLVALAVAVALACAAQARRLGRPVPEAPVVPVAASELTVATGRLMARNHQQAEAGQLLRDGLDGRLRARYGMPAGASAATVAEVAATRTGLPMEEMLVALCGPAPRNDEELVHLATTLKELEEKMLAGARD